MKKLLIMLCVALALGAVAFSTLAATGGSCGDNVTWTLDDDGLLTITGTGAITSHAWTNSENVDDVKKVKISEGITSICQYAFNGCLNVTSVELPEGLVSIGKHAFDFCPDLVDMTLPSTVRTIEECAFYQCEALPSIDIPDGVTVIPDNAFTYCFRMERVGIPSSVQEIGEGAFDHCEALLTATVPDGVKAIKINTFAECYSLRTVDLPKSLTSLEQNAFINCRSLEQITLPDSVNYINGNAFKGCTSLTGFVFPTSLTDIKWNLFENCTGLQTLQIPQAIYEIEEYAFRGCTGLKKVTVLNPNLRFDEGCFDNCPNLTLAGIDGSTTQTFAKDNGIPFEVIGELWSEPVYSWAENGISVTATRHLEKDETVIETETVGTLRHVTLSPTETKPGEAQCTSDAFQNPAFEVQTTTIVIPALGTVNVLRLPETVQTIEAEAFMGASCHAVIVPQGCKSIGAKAFADCDILLYVHMPAGITVADDAFEGSDFALIDTGE